ncbi:RPII140-upstream gene protein-like [Watersipora subatra]|uniref:RPII140-upstream gene protein-like n=1 Tax=Watersipora subatra TaxID=2589382 RepID=UPI00355BAF76
MSAVQDDIEAEIEQYLRLQNPFDRVRRLYEINPKTSQLYEENKVCKSIAYFSSTLIGSIAFSLTAPIARYNYIRANTHTVHKTKWLGSRRAADAYMFGGLKKGGKWFLITALTVTCYSKLSQAIELYRIKTSAYHYGFSGTVLGATSRVLLGPKGMLGGAFIGGYFGLVVGFAVTAYMRFTGINVEKRLHDEAKCEIEANRFYKEHGEMVAKQLEAVDGVKKGDRKEGLVSSSKNLAEPIS